MGVLHMFYHYNNNNNNNNNNNISALTAIQQDEAGPANILTHKGIIHEVLEECKGRMIYYREFLSSVITAQSSQNWSQTIHHLLINLLFNKNIDPKEIPSPESFNSGFMAILKKRYQFYKFIIEIFEQKPKDYIDLACLLFETQIVDEEIFLNNSKWKTGKLSLLKRNEYEKFFLTQLKKKLQKETSPEFLKFKNVISFTPQHRHSNEYLYSLNFSELFKVLDANELSLKQKATEENMEDPLVSDLLLKAIRECNRISKKVQEQFNTLIVNSKAKSAQKGVISLEERKKFIEDCRSNYNAVRLCANEIDRLDKKITEDIKLASEINTLMAKCNYTINYLLGLGNFVCNRKERLIFKTGELAIDLSTNLEITQLKNQFIDNLDAKIKVLSERGSDIVTAYRVENHEDTIEAFSLMIEELNALENDIVEFSIKNLDLIKKLKEETIKEKVSQRIEFEKKTELVLENKRLNQEKLKAFREKMIEEKRLRKLAKDKAMAEELVRARASIITNEGDEKNEAEFIALQQDAYQLYMNLNSTNKQLIAEIFSKPAPHYTIEYQAFLNLLSALGGRIESPGAGGSHRKITLGPSMAYFDFFEEVDEANPEDPRTAVTTVVKAHKSGVPKGKLSRIDINNIRELLERRYITPALENAEILQNSSGQTEKTRGGLKSRKT